MSKGVKTRLEKPTETADLNKGLFMDPRLGNQHRTVPDPLKEEVSLEVWTIYGATGSGSVFIPSTQMDFGSPLNIGGYSLCLDTWGGSRSCSK